MISTAQGLCVPVESVLLSDSLRQAPSSLGEAGDFAPGHWEARSGLQDGVEQACEASGFWLSTRISLSPSFLPRHRLCSGVTAEEARAGLVVTGEDGRQMTVSGEPGRTEWRAFVPCHHNCGLCLPSLPRNIPIPRSLGADDLRAPKGAGSEPPKQDWICLHYSGNADLVK